MRALPPAIAAAAASGVTTFCTAWRVTRRDARVLGFTDHDRDLVIDGITFAAASAVSGSESVAQQGLAVTGSEVTGALTSEAITEADIARGLYDGAIIEVLLVDFTAPESPFLLRRGTLGEARREDGAFICEVRALSDGLNEVQGRLFSALCDADLGDARCGVSLADPPLRRVGTVADVSGLVAFSASGLEGATAGDFTGGRLVFTSGANAGFASEVKIHGAPADAGAGARIELWQAPPAPFAEGDAFAVTAGCDRRFSTCRDRFANALNFRGFPHMPGNDFVITVAVPGDGGYDGGMLRT